ncbi:MAG TPA: peptidylprolyl isomerase, partial [Phycisphaerales bacterium]|nr:peptidylprolyl isomerase [Phycisphaerales bacterium]
TRIDFAKVASREIARKLREIINDELLQAEARSSLSPEQRQGFRYWVQSLQADYVSRNYRSRTMAEQRLAEAQEATSLEEWTRKREERELIMLQLREQVLKNVHVPFREVEMNYNRRYEEFNPPERMQFRVISIPRGDTASIESARTDLDAGTDFAEVASRPFNLFRPSEGGLYTPPPVPAAGAGPDGVTAQRKYFEIPSLNEAAHRLTSGSWSGPIETGSTMSFLRLDVIREPSTSLYEAQVSIEQSLRSAKTEQLMVKYIDQLVKRASVDDIEEMGQRLLDASMERYWIAQRGT